MPPEEDRGGAVPLLGTISLKSLSKSPHARSSERVCYGSLLPCRAQRYDASREPIRPPAPCPERSSADHRASGLVAISQAGQLANFSSFVNRAVHDAVIARNPIRGLRLPDMVARKGKRHPFSADQWQAIFNAPLMVRKNAANRESKSAFPDEVRTANRSRTRNAGPAKRCAVRRDQWIRRRCGSQWRCRSGFRRAGWLQNRCVPRVLR